MPNLPSFIQMLVFLPTLYFIDGFQSESFLKFLKILDLKQPPKIFSIFKFLKFIFEIVRFLIEFGNRLTNGRIVSRPN